MSLKKCHCNTVGNVSHSLLTSDFLSLDLVLVPKLWWLLPLCLAHMTAALSCHLTSNVILRTSQVIYRITQVLARNSSGIFCAKFRKSVFWSSSRPLSSDELWDPLYSTTELLRQISGLTSVSAGPTGSGTALQRRLDLRRVWGGPTTQQSRLQGHQRLHHRGQCGLSRHRQVADLSALSAKLNNKCTSKHGFGTSWSADLERNVQRLIWAAAEQKVNKVDIEGHCQAYQLSCSLTVDSWETFPACCWQLQTGMG